jgi:hypothetical protein
MGDSVYIFLDESGDLGFTSAGSRYFVLSSVIMQRPFDLYRALEDLRYTCLEEGSEFEYFHCTNNTRSVRDRVFDLLGSGMTGKTLDSLIIEKPKTGPALRHEDRFYPEMLAYLLRYVLNRPAIKAASEVIVITDTPPLRRRRNATEKAVKTSLAKMLPRGIPYRIVHHSSQAHYGLQIADYCSWAIFRKYETGDRSAYDRIRSAIWSEFDIFQTGTRYYY